MSAASSDHAPRRGKRTRRLAHVLALVGIWALPIAGLLAAVHIASAGESRSTSADMPDRVVVGERTVTGRTSVELAVTFERPFVLTTRATGLITQVRMGTDAALSEGDLLVRVDGAGIYALRAGAPLYRDLAVGSEGADVKELGQLLVSMGMLEKAGAEFDADYLEAVRRFQKESGRAERDGVFRPSYVVFVPDGATALEEIVVRPGETVSDGASLAEAAPAPLRGRLVAADADALGRIAGASVVLVAGSARLPLPGLAEFSAEETRDTLAAIDRAIASGDFASTAVAHEGEQTTVSQLFVELSSPERFGSVPASSVYGAPTGTTCVFIADGPAGAPRAQRVSVTASIDPGTVLVDEDLISASVVADLSAVSSSVRETCE